MQGAAFVTGAGGGIGVLQRWSAEELAARVEQKRRARGL
jgi:hypothetical protein